MVCGDLEGDSLYGAASRSKLTVELKSLAAWWVSRLKMTWVSHLVRLERAPCITRWLYVPIAEMMILVAPVLPRCSSKPK